MQDGLAPDVRRRRGAPARRGRHLLHHRLQRAGRAAQGARGRRRRGAPQGASTTSPTRPTAATRTPAGPAAGLRRRLPVGPERPSSCSPRTGACRADTWSVTSWNELARDAVAAEEWNLLHPARGAADAVRHDEAAGRRRARSSRSATTCAPCPLQIAQWVPDRLPRRSAPTGSASPTPGRPRGGSSSVDAQSVVVQALAGARRRAARSKPRGRAGGVRPVPHRRPDRRRRRQAGGRRRLSASGGDRMTRSRTSAQVARQLQHAVGDVTKASLAPHGTGDALVRRAAAEHRSWIGMILQAGYNSFVTWYRSPTNRPRRSPSRCSATRPGRSPASSTSSRRWR